MKKGGTGGSNTLTGLIYEAKVDLGKFLNSQDGYRVDDTRVYYNETLVARLFKKHALYRFLADNNVDWKKHQGYLQPIITQYFIDNKSEIWLLFLIAHSKR